MIVPIWNEREKKKPFGMLREKAKAGGSGRHPKEIIGCNKAEQPVGYVGRVPYTKQAAEPISDPNVAWKRDDRVSRGTDTRERKKKMEVRVVNVL